MSNIEMSIFQIPNDPPVSLFHVSSAAFYKVRKKISYRDFKVLNNTVIVELTVARTIQKQRCVSPHITTPL
jgi:hypothetical protein